MVSYSIVLILITIVIIIIIIILTNFPKLFSRNNLKKRNQQSSVTKISEQVINVLIVLQQSKNRNTAPPL